MQQEQQLISKKEAEHRNSSHNRILNLLRMEKKSVRTCKKASSFFCVKNHGYIKQ